MQPFTDPAMVASYVESTPRKVPGFADLHRMAVLLLAERTPATANILALGVGGGLELKALVEACRRFVSVDPSAEMLDLASRILGPPGMQVELHQGIIRVAEFSDVALFYVGISFRASASSRERYKSTGMLVCG